MGDFGRQVIPNGQVSQAVKQFQFPHLAKAGLLQLERYPVFTCEQCGVSKYRFHERDYFYFPEHAFSSESDFWVMQGMVWTGTLWNVYSSFGGLAAGGGNCAAREVERGGV